MLVVGGGFDLARNDTATWRPEVVRDQRPPSGTDHAVAGVA